MSDNNKGEQENEQKINQQYAQDFANFMRQSEENGMTTPSFGYGDTSPKPPGLGR